MSRQTGPRRLVLNDLKSFNNQPSLQAVDDGAESGYLAIHSSSKPALKQGSTYTITANQEIQYTDANGDHTQPTLSAAKTVQVQGSKISLDPFSIHSVYPPAGHTDYWNILPHVLFNNSQVPWAIDGAGAKSPWLGVLVFTHDELALSSDDLAKLKTATGSYTADPIVQSPTLAVPMTYAGLQKSTGYTDSNATLAANANTSVIFLKNAFFNEIFSDAARFNVMSHVRTIDSTGMSGIIDDTGTYAVSISPRCGPRSITQPTAVYVHLVTLPTDARTATDLPFSGLISLYSWTYSCLPFASFSLTKTMLNLGNSIQPMRIPDEPLNSSQQGGISWVKSRMRAGYTLARYRPQSGEVTMSIHRGPLIPTNPYSIGDPSERDMPPSNFGSDLAILDREVGILDLTFQMAWELGRTLAIADRTFSSALMRVKNTSHSTALTTAKLQLDQSSNNPKPTFVPIKSAVGGFSHVQQGLANAGAMPQATLIDSRWQRPTTQPGNRAQYSFVNDAVKAQYSTCCSDAALKLAMASPPRDNTGQLQSGAKTVYNELNVPDSIDFASILRWILDKWFLSGIPPLHLIPDPLFVPKESIRSFYIDPTWIKCFVDGALSITEHFTPADDIRESIKECLSHCINTPNDGQTPRLPKWGFFLRSEMVVKFPNLRISAPMDNATGTEILRWDVIDDDLMLALFDRIPGTSAFPSGIVIEPPGHQLSFALGTDSDWATDQNSITTWTVRWKTFKDANNTVFTAGNATAYASSATTGFDFANNILNTSQFIKDATATEQKTVSKAVTQASYPAMTGVQLIATHPSLTLDDVTGLSASQTPPNALTTTAKSKTALKAPATTFPYNFRRTLKSGGTSIAISIASFERPQGDIVQLLNYASVENSYEIATYLLGVNAYPTEPSNLGLTNAQAQSQGKLPDLNPLLQTHTYNLFSHVMSDPFQQLRLNNQDCSGLFVITPEALQVPQNIQVRSKFRQGGQDGSIVNASGYKLSSVRYAFKIGAQAPDPVSNPSSYNLFNTISPSSGSSTLTPLVRTAQDFPHKATSSSYLRPATPAVRNMGRGKRWVLNIKYPDADAENMFTVTAIPNLGDLTPGKYAWDLTENLDIHFLIEGVVPNYAPEGLPV